MTANTYLNSSVPGRRLEDSSSTQSLSLHPQLACLGAVWDNFPQHSAMFLWRHGQPGTTWLSLLQYRTLLLFVSPSPQLRSLHSACWDLQTSVAHIIREKVFSVSTHRFSSLLIPTSPNASAAEFSCGTSLLLYSVPWREQPKPALSICPVPFLFLIHSPAAL